MVVKDEGTLQSASGEWYLQKEWEWYLQKEWEW